MSDNYIYGYASVSTHQQDLNKQLDLLNQYNCIDILTKKITGTKLDNLELIRIEDKVITAIH